MKVIFLDIDGVLNCHKTPNPRKVPYVIDDGLLARFRQLIERTGASVVLSLHGDTTQQASSAPSTTAFPS